MSRRAGLAMLATVLAGTGGLARAEVGVVTGSITITRAPEVPPGAVLVYLVGFTEPAPKHPVEVRQVGKRFLPELFAVTAGGSVTFPNGDPFLHNVFSPTTERSFDLGSYRQGETRARTFPRLGVIDIYCNIHPEMSATLVILPNTKFTIADATGHFVIRDVPVGTWSVFAYSRRAAQPVTGKVTVTAGGTAEITLALDEVQRELEHRNKYGQTYRPTTIYPPGS